MSALKVTGTSRGGVHSERIADVLRYMAQLTIEHRERWMTEAANAQTSLDEMSVLMPQYFYHLKNSSAITAFLLLNSFTLQREAEELRESRRELEDHISKLKSRISELEEDGGTAFPAGQQKCAQILSAENARLRLAHAELFRINQQWALDYEALSNQKLADTETVEEPCTSANERSRHLEQRVEMLSSELSSQTQTVREANRKIRLLEDEKAAIEIQLRELGNLDEALAWKNDVTRLRSLLKQKEHQYQEVIAINVHTRKQLQRLKSAFYHVLVPRPNTRPTMTSRRPDHTYCPTPTGLLARGDVEVATPGSHDVLITTFACPSCSRVMEGTPSGYHQWCEHIQSCGN